MQLDRTRGLIFHRLSHPVRADTAGQPGASQTRFRLRRLTPITAMTSRISEGRAGEKKRAASKLDGSLATEAADAAFSIGTACKASPGAGPKSARWNLARRFAESLSTSSRDGRP